MAKRVGTPVESISNITIPNCEELFGTNPNDNVFNILHQPLCHILTHKN